MTTTEDLADPRPPAANEQVRGNQAERFGIVVKFPGVCGICGVTFVLGDRIFKLPKSRRSSMNPWLCRGCRYPDNRDEPTLEEGFVKLNHRNHTGRTPGLNRHDVGHLLALYGTLTDESASALEDMPALLKLRRAHAERVSANLNRADVLDLLEGFVRHGLIKRVGRSHYYSIPSKVGLAGS